MSEIRGVLLDVDGTLLDSNDAHADAVYYDPADPLARFGTSLLARAAVTA